MRIAVLVNPHSRANRKNPALRERMGAILAGEGEVIAPQSLEDLAVRARDLAAAGPSVIGVHGGDGTLHRTVAALIGAWGDKPLPPIAILAGGTMNVVSASLGIRADPFRLLGQIVADSREGRAPETVTRRCLRVGNTFGFIFGNGMMSNFLVEYYAKPGYGPRRAMWILLRTFCSALIRGAYARKIFRRFTGQIAVDGQALPWKALTGVGVATVREVGMGFKLNHRADDDPDRFGVLAIHSGPLALTPDLVAVHRGRGISPTRAWSGVASHMVIEPDEVKTAYTIDGDLYRADGAIDIAIGPTLAFVKPRKH